MQTPQFLGASGHRLDEPTLEPESLAEISRVAPLADVLLLSHLGWYPWQLKWQLPSPQE